MRSFAIFLNSFAAFAGFLFVLGAGVGAFAQGSSELRPAAIVNDEVISELDVAQRIRLAIISSGLEDTPETRQRLAGTVLRGLIDERLQVQEAERLEISISEEDVNRGLGEVAGQNNMSSQELLQALQRAGVLPSIFIDQVRSQILWNTVIQLRIDPQVVVTEEDVSTELRKLREDAGKRERLVGEIYLAVDNPSQEPQVRASMEQLLQQLSSGGQFSQLARQFSQSATAASGGVIGWVLEGELAPELEQALATMEPGTVNGPIRTIDGYYILALQRVRTVEASDDILRLTRVNFPTGGQDIDDVVSEANEIMSDVLSCAQAQGIAEQLANRGSADLGEVTLSSLPGNVQSAIEDLPVGRPSAPVRTDQGVSVYVVCLRESRGISRDRIEDSLRREQRELQIRRYMRDLRRGANIEMRI